MKVTAILLFAACLHVHARSYGQNITLSVKNAPLEKVFGEVKKQTGYSFIYTRELLERASAVSLDVKNVSLEQFLENCFKDQPLSWSVEKKFIIIKPKPVGDLILQRGDTSHLPHPAIDVHGRVTDVSGNPLAGASVMVGDKASFTDASGEFQLRGVPENATVSVSNVGYETQEIKLDKRKELTIRMSVKVNQLQDVEVTYNSGYQVLSKERATGSYAKPDMETFRNRTGSQDVVSRLDGLVPGLTITHGVSGIIGSSGIIRGRSSVSLDQNPLYVLNGVVVTGFADINPDDIADITVLKDAAAAAIWGARAANGVIVVTTKSGKRDSKVKVNYSGYINYQGKPDFGYIPVLSSPQFIQAAKETFDPVANPWGDLYNSYVAPHEVILYNQYRGLITDGQANTSLDSLAGINNMDQVKKIWYRNAFTTNHTLSMSGGGGVYSFYSSFSWTGTRSNTIGEKNNGYRLNLTQNVNPNKNIKISLTTALNNTISAGAHPIAIDNSFLPYQLFRDQNGNSISMPYVQGWPDSLRNDYQARSRVDLNYNPIDAINYGSSKSNNLAVSLTGNVNIRLWKGLSFLGTYGYVKAPGNSTSYDDHQEYSLRKRLVGMTVAPTAADVPVYYLPVAGGTYTRSTNDQRNYTIRNQLSYVTSPGNGKDELSLQAGQEAMEQYSTNEQVILEGYDQDLQTYALLDYNLLGQGIPNTVSSFYGSYYQPPFTIRETLTRFTSYFALGSYTYHHKYSVDLSWRQDHSNLFGKEKSTQNRPIWSLGGKWQVSRENFMKPLTWINDLGLRATYGITGNSPNPGAASSKDVLNSPMPYPPAISGPALAISGTANTTLTWETTQTFNMGIDFSLLKRRLSGSIEGYHKSTINLLGNVDLNPFTGTTRGQGNLGHLVNTGIELSLRTINVQTKDFTWSTSLVFAYNKNKLVSYSTVSSSLNTAYNKMAANYWVGYSAQPVFAYKWAGLDNEGDPRIMLKDKSVTRTPDVATADDVYYKGTTLPVVNGGFSNTFRYKGISLALNLVYSLGNVMRRDVNHFYSGRLTGEGDGAFTGNIPAYFVNRWKKPGDEKITNIPSYVSDSYTNYSRRSTDYYVYADINVVSAAYAKFRDITLSYNLPRTLLQSMKIEGINIYVQANNFMLWKANKAGIDPEYQNLTYGNRIVMRSKHPISIGANVSF